MLINQLFINGIITGSIYALIAIGFIVIYRTVNFFNFAHGAIYLTGAYLAYTLTNTLSLPLLICFFFASIISGLFGVLIDRSVYRPLLRHKAANLIFLIASFGIFILLQNLIQLIYGAQKLTLRTGEITAGHPFLGAKITDNQILILVATAFLATSLFIFLQKTKLGKAMRAVADDPLAASVVGINPERVISIAFFIGSALAGAAGILISLETSIDPSMGFNAILQGIIASIIGGIGSIPGALLGGLLLGFVENLSVYWLGGGWKDTIAFGVLILFLLFRPNGILNAKALLISKGARERI